MKGKKKGKKITRILDDSEKLNRQRSSLLSSEGDEEDEFSDHSGRIHNGLAIFSDSEEFQDDHE